MQGHDLSCVENVDYVVCDVVDVDCCETAAYMQAMSVGGLVESTPAAAVQLKRSMREELRRLIHESSIVIARDRLRLLDIVGQGIIY